MLKSIYNEKENLISNGLENKISLLKSDKCKILDTKSIIFINETSDNEIYDSLQKSLEDKSINPHLVFNKLPLSNNNFIINI